MFQFAGNFEESNRGNGRLEVLIHFSEDIGNTEYCAPISEMYVNGATDFTITELFPVASQGV